MYPIEVTPLSVEHATDLAAKLIRGTKIETANITATAQVIAESVGCIPFYIHHLVNDLRNERQINSNLIQATIERSLVHAQNPWKMDHYKDRLANYYQAEQQSYALNILDTLSTSTKLSLSEICSRLSVNPLFANRANLCLLYTSPSPRDLSTSRMPSSA